LISASLVKFEYDFDFMEFVSIGNSYTGSVFGLLESQILSNKERKKERERKGFELMLEYVNKQLRHAKHGISHMYLYQIILSRSLNLVADPTYWDKTWLLLYLY